MDLDRDTPIPLYGAGAEPAAHDAILVLLRSLVTALSCRAGALVDEAEGEEVLLDADADGYRYLLVRTKSTSGSRAHLSPREQEIARMVAAGYPSKAIASVLNISCWTVGTHLRRIYAKLGVNTRAGMVGRLNELHIGAHPRSQPPAPAAASLERKRA
ncbi:helix-turn-helix transcriptional regulator [Paraburkholderia sp. PGU19]|uniref:helix-turn-helix transcriptional regulator n=1 Tax=Paraburkholderia sp. PGU19 TaxID=2735434 RepID=UPI0015DB58B6|nr:helix-turn-helix transcriptional regulator [Paraburkholderia sp. PGU19]